MASNLGRQRPQIPAGEIESLLERLYNDMTAATAKSASDVVAALKAKMPEGYQIDLPAKPALASATGKYGLSIDYSNLPLQAAVDFVAYLVNLESGRQKFVRGVPTVGGRTHIGVITPGEGFRLLNEPELIHTNIGFSREI